ncbi:MAG: ATP-binding protein [Candidatus Brockarchaeota archaeon]|nr:ATP-binding protein [Candidatus Brockarchaeota archaeon]
METLLRLMNEWWETRSISREKARKYRRKVFSEVEKTYFQYNQILILTGLRRVGKTTIIHQLIEELLKKGHDPKSILYFSFDEMVEDPLKVLEEYARITKVDWRSKRVFLFLDEVHKLRGWSSKIKILYDSLPNLKICVSGSASIAVETEAIRNLAGRFFTFEVQPLTLREFAEIYFEREMDDFELYEDRLKTIFEDYIRKPFPEIVKWDDPRRVNEYIRTLVVEKVMKSDIPGLFDNVNVSLLSTLTETFMKNVGMILNITSISRELGVHKLTLVKHIKFLEYSKLIRIVKNYRPSIRAESRKLVKIYPYNIALSFCFYPELSSGQISEGLVASALNLTRYWRKNQREVDFLKTNGEIVPIEVKEKSEVKLNELKNLLWFMEKHKVNRGIVFHKGRGKIIEVGDKKIMLYPLLKLLFNFAI